MIKKRGIALIVVIMVIFVASALLILVSSVTDADAETQVLRREKVRAEVLAMGAVQHALLKIRSFPTEFYDAAILEDPDGTQRIGHHLIEQARPEYMGQILQDEDGAFYITGDFVRDLGMIMGPDVDEGFVEDEEFEGQIMTEAPFGGVYFVQEIELLSRNLSNLQDTIRIQVYSKEISGFTTGLLRPALRGTQREVAVDESITYSVVKELKWR